jgi:hypothetical protein
MDIQDQSQFMLCVDEESSHFRAKAGKDAAAFFDGDKPSALSLNAMAFCTEFQEALQVTQELGRALKAANILTPTRSDAKLQNGREIVLAGFNVIDEEKLRALPDAQILEFHQKGWLPLIYIALASASNWRNLINMASLLEPKA